MTASNENRRSFLRKLAAAGVGGLTISGMACKNDRAVGDAEGGLVGTAEPLIRPVLLPWSEDVVRISAPPAELPVAYVSMTLRHVFVDHAFRDRASGLLDAHISVSTALWRIPLAGDPAGQPVTPGDERREFEELDIREWDPTMPPAAGDIRIRRGNRITRRVHFACVALGGAGDGVDRQRWFSAGPWAVDLGDGRAQGTTREDFMIVGAGSRHDTRSCDGSGTQVRYLMWACP